MALALRQQREAQHLTARQAAANLGQTSPNAYARFERHKSKISLAKFSSLLAAVGVQTDVVVRVGPFRRLRV
jgi:transcriptional regulator with XRE-family HTH domain